MNDKIDWLSDGGNRVLKIKMTVHHAPMYFTLFIDNIIELSYDIDYPTMDKDIIINIPSMKSMEKRIENAKTVEETSIEDSPFLEVNEKPRPKIPSNRAIRMNLPTIDEQKTVQDVIQLQNGKYLSVGRKSSGNIFLVGVSQSQVQEKLLDDSIEKQSLPRTSVGIPYNPLTCKPENPSLGQY